MGVAVGGGDVGVGGTVGTRDAVCCRAILRYPAKSALATRNPIGPFIFSPSFQRSVDLDAREDGTTKGDTTEWTCSVSQMLKGYKHAVLLQSYALALIYLLSHLKGLHTE